LKFHRDKGKKEYPTPNLRRKGRGQRREKDKDKRKGRKLYYRKRKPN